MRKGDGSRAAGAAGTRDAGAAEREHLAVKKQGRQGDRLSEDLGGEGVSQAALLGKCVPSRGNGQRKGPEVGLCSAGSRTERRPVRPASSE